MKLSDFNFNLPKKLIAQKPQTPRDSARLLVLDRNNDLIQHKIFHQLDNFLKKGDVLVFNKSKVIPARIKGEKESGGKIEILLLHQIKEGIWEVLLNRKAKPNSKIILSKNFHAEVLSPPTNKSKWKIKFNITGNRFKKYLDTYGEMPLPPYIKLKAQKNTKKQYQTVYADSKREGSVAAPTAGLHFTNRLLNKLKRKGVQLEYVTLHVGLGTFEPVRLDNVKQHLMHAELAEIEQKTLQRLHQAKKEGRRIIAVGTTTVRVLESFSSQIIINYSNNNSIKEWVDIFIYPGFKFSIIDGLITNFHLPKSTLLMLVSAFAGPTKIKKAYQEAIDKKYRFYSYGDAMLII